MARNKIKKKKKTTPTTPDYYTFFKRKIPMMLNPEIQQLQSFQNSQQSPLGSLQGSRKKYAQVTNFTLIKNRPWGR